MRKTIIIIAALALASLSYGKSMKSQIEKLAISVNKQTPIITDNGRNWIIDSVRYDKDKNVLSYYHSSLLIYDDILSTNIMGMNEESLKQQICSALPKDDPDLQLIMKAGTDLRYQYKKSTGEIVRTFTIENQMLSKKSSQEEEKAMDIRLMNEMAQNVNAQCPLNVDIYTVLTSCNYDEQNYILTYNYDVTLDYENTSKEEFEFKMKNVLTANIRNSVAFTVFKRNNVTFKYKYKFNGKETREIVVMPIDYK